MQSADGRFQLTYQSDGNLVLSQQGTQLWASNTGGTSPGKTIMQTDGNLVIYDGGGHGRLELGHRWKPGVV